MKQYLEIDIHGESFFLLPQKALFRPLHRQIILGDVHLGKATHFRKQGIAMPAQSHLKDIDTLHYLLNFWTPYTVILLGDLFHSSYNREWMWFRSVVMEYPQIRFFLVEGNHDILPEEAYRLPNLFKFDLLEETRLILSHHPLEEAHKFNICGHLHPGIRITGEARQSIKLPCFYRSPTHLILPAFGNLTGMKLLEREADAEYYVIANNSVIKAP